MAVNKIKISANTRKVLNKTKEILGIQGENMKDVLFFALSEKIDGTAVVEIELPNGVQSFVELIKVEDGYELPVKSVLTEQAGFVKFQLRILQNKVEVFKSEIFELEVKESLNAIYEEPEEYPTWLDKLEDLQTELNNSEKERISNENERIESEEARKENFTQMQKSVKGAISNIKDLTENYNLNATEKTNKFDENYTEKKKAFDDNYSETLKSFNDNAETKYDNYNKNAENKTSEYNKNNDEKLKAYNDNHTTKITNFDTNAKNKTDEYNSNASKKLDDYNSNDTTKTEKYNENATTKLSDYNSNATAKKKEYDTNAENKIVEFNNNATEKLDEYNQNAESLTNRVIECESENERLRNDIKSIALTGEASGENIHLEDSSEARCEIEIGGNQKQNTREGYNQFKITSKQTQGAGITITKIDESSVSYQGTTTGSFTHILVEYDGNGLEMTKQMYLKAFGNLANASFLVKIIRSGETETRYLTISPDLILNVGDVLQQVYVQQRTTGILVSGTLQVLLTDYENKDKPYEQYGASPSIDFSSNIKCVNADFKIDIANKNFLNITSPLKTHSYAGLAIDIAEDGMFTINGTSIGARWPDFIWGIGNNTVVHSNCKYYFKKVMKKATFSMKIVSGNISGRFAPSVVFNDDANVNIGLSMTELSKSVEGEMTGINRAYFSIPSGTTFNNFKFYLQLEEDLVETEYKSHQSQSYTIDVQQEMLEGDTFVRQDGKWYEKHCWEKMLLNGTEKAGVSGTSTNEILAIVYDINNAVDGFGYSNCFLYSYQVELNKMTVYNDGKSLRVNVSKMQFADLEAFTTKLKELYEAGTPVIIYYKLAEPTMLECTEAQSKVLDEIYSKAHTYKNITNISAESSEVNPIINVKYLKDAETEHNKLQAQIDEIKQLLSTTETSAMLLNNMQTDLESEV